MRCIRRYDFDAVRRFIEPKKKDYLWALPPGSSSIVFRAWPIATGACGSGKGNGEKAKKTDRRGVCEENAAVILGGCEKIASRSRRCSSEEDVRSRLRLPCRGRLQQDNDDRVSHVPVLVKSGRVEYAVKEYVAILVGVGAGGGDVSTRIVSMQEQDPEEASSWDRC